MNSIINIPITPDHDPDLPRATLYYHVTGIDPLARLIAALDTLQCMDYRVTPDPHHFGQWRVYVPLAGFKIPPHNSPIYIGNESEQTQ